MPPREETHEDYITQGGDMQVPKPQNVGRVSPPRFCLEPSYRTKDGCCENCGERLESHYWRDKHNKAIKGASDE